MLRRAVRRFGESIEARIAREQAIVKQRFELEKERDLQAKVIPKDEEVNPTGEYGYKPRGPEPTRYGDWERKGRVSDF